MEQRPGKIKTITPNIPLPPPFPTLYPELMSDGLEYPSGQGHLSCCVLPAFHVPQPPPQWGT